MQQIIEYPLLVYNSYLPTNSELVVTSLAEKEKVSYVVSLGQYLQFITFVDSPYLVNDFLGDHIKSNDCMVFFLAWHT